MFMSLEPKQAVGESMRDDFTLCCIEPVTRAGRSRKFTSTISRCFCVGRRVVDSIRGSVSTARSQLVPQRQNYDAHRKHRGHQFKTLHKAFLSCQSVERV